jgi:hypothetical protein
MIYADKTEYIHKMLQNPRNYFLARPRRFGKSTLLDTMAELFKGNSELFKGLWIYNSGYQFPKYPVIRLSMAYALSEKPGASLEDCIIENLKENAEDYHLSLIGVKNNYESIFQAVVKGLSLKFQSEANQEPNPLSLPTIDPNVVILIDEYDAPILRRVGSNLELAKRNMETLYYFYRLFKRLDTYIHFTFVTGISQVGMSSLGQSALNFVDISLLPEYAGICGFNATDLESLFGDHFEETLANLKSISKMPPSATVSDLKDKILYFYDGYNFDGKYLDEKNRVLNPLSIVSFFRDKDFSQYWLDTGPPTFLDDFVAKNPDIFIDAQDSTYTEPNLSVIPLSAPDSTALLFQFGYLTLDSVESVGELSHFTLKIPNIEVARAFGDVYLQNFFKIKNTDIKNKLTKELKSAFVSANSLKIEEILSNVLSSLPYFQHEPSEKLYHMGLQLFFNGLSLDIRLEVATAWGRSNLDLILENDVYVCLELKYVTCPVKKSAQKPSAQLTNSKDLTLEFLLISPPFSAKQMEDFKYIYPDFGVFSDSQKDILISTLAKDEPLTSAQFMSLLSKLETTKDPPKNPSVDAKPPLSLIPDKILKQTAQKALDQIQTRGYTNKYKLSSKVIVEIGLAIGGRNQVKVIAKKIKG